VRRDGRSATITCHVTPTTKAQVTAEAWESGLSMDEYVGTLLSSRGKWKRMVGSAGNYLLGPTEKGKRGRRA
jgi:hypothetical protein